VALEHRIDALERHIDRRFKEVDAKLDEVIRRLVWKGAYESICRAFYLLTVR